jgi:hypothetical protein
MEIERRAGADRRRGPKPARGESATAAVSIRLTPTERRDLEQIAAENHHASLADAIREAINEYVADFRDRPCF